MTACKDGGPQLSLLVDGALDADDERVARGHLAECRACRGLLHDLEELRRTARELGPVAPPEQAWRRIAADIAEGELRPQGKDGSQWTRLPARYWTALAAMLAVAVAGISLVRLVHLSAADDPPGNAVARASVQPVTEALNAAAGQYDGAISALEGIARDEDNWMDPAVASAIGRDLGTIDRAIAESRRAIADSPFSELARDSLFDALDRKVDLLQIAVSLIDQMREADRGGVEGGPMAMDNNGRKS